MNNPLQFKPTRQAPVYRQIAAYFERKISDGSLKENDRLPSTAELARQFGVNRETIQQSMRLLTRPGEEASSAAASHRKASGSYSGGGSSPVPTSCFSARCSGC